VIKSLFSSCSSFNPGHPDMACATLRYQTK
jgi:hypothetical protein